MAGPYPPEYGAGPLGPQMYPQYPAQPYPDNIPSVPSAYPGMLPPPVPYPKKRRGRIVAAVVVAVAGGAALVTGIVLAAGDHKSGDGGMFTETSAKAAIQQYLDALSKGDDETVARHTLCGLYDAVKERRSDLALASLSSDAFRKQYSHVEVTSIDKMVLWSPNQAQVLFTMKVAPASGSSRTQQPSGEEQAIAQLLSQDNEILVCSYLPRSTGQY